MECRKVQEKLHAYLEDALSPGEKDLIHNHVSSCPHCKAVVEEIEKTGDFLRNLDQMEPPSWLLQRIMGRIREEAEDRRGIVDRLFRPLRIKIPLQALAFVLIVGLATLVYRESLPKYERGRTIPPAGSSLLKDRTARPGTGETGKSTLQSGSGSAAPGARPKQEVPAPTVRGGPARRLSGKQEKETPASSAEPSETVKSLALPAPSAQEEERALEPAATAGAIRQDGSAGQPNTLRSAAPPFAAKSERAKPFNITVKSEDAEGTASQIERFLKTIGARQVTTESKSGVWVLSAEVKKDDLPQLFEVLGPRVVPEVTRAPVEGARTSADIPIRIEITGP